MRLLSLLCLAAATAACSVPGGHKSSATTASVPTADIAVLPVYDATGHTRSPVDEMRRSATAYLVEQGYSPISRELIDRQYRGGAVPASALRLPESGILEIRVVEWRDREVGTRGRVTADLEAVYYGPDGRELVRMSGPGFKSLEPGEMAGLDVAERKARLIAEVMKELLAPLPDPPPL